MIDINKVNSKLNYTEFYNMPNENWDSWVFYNNLPDNIANNYNFLNTFKHKIMFRYLFSEKKIKLKYIKSFINFYHSGDWYSILCNQNITPEFLNKYYKKIKCEYIHEQTYIKLMKHKNKLNSKVICFLESKREVNHSYYV